MASESGGFRPIGARLRAPQGHVATVPRTALLRRLTSSAQRLVLVSAPAGYGKTTLVRQWLELEAVPAVWLRLEALHDDPVALLTYLAAALAKVASLDPAIERLLATPQPPIEERLLPELVAAVEQAPPFILVLDDAHVLTAGPAWRYLGFLLDALPDGARLVATSRSDPPLPLPRLRAEGDLLEIRTGDLRMSREETQQLLRLHQVPPDDASLDALLERTEGWPAGLYLSLLAGDVTEVHGDRHEIATYLTSEVLDRQPAEVQGFLLRTSVLHRLSAASCRAVTARPDAGVTLDRLARENLFVAPLDDHDEEFRYHQMFGELLYAQLLRRVPDEAGDLHRRASAWCEERGDLDGAVRHAVLAGDGDTVRTTDLAAVACDRFMCTGQYRRALSLFDCFSDKEVSKWPALALTAAQLGAVTVDLRVQRLGSLALSTPMSYDPAPLGVSSLRGWQVVIRAMRAPDGVTCMLEDAELACVMLAHAPDVSFLDAAEATRAMALYLLGRTRRSLDLVTSALAEAGKPGHPRVVAGSPHAHRCGPGGLADRRVPGRGGPGSPPYHDDGASSAGPRTGPGASLRPADRGLPRRHQP